MLAVSCQSRICGSLQALPSARQIIRCAAVAALALTPLLTWADNLSFSGVSATFEQTNGGPFLAVQMTDGITSGRNGWGIYRDAGGSGDHTFSERALFTLTTPLAAGPQRLVFNILQNVGGGQVLETFSLGYTTAVGPTLGSTQTAVNISTALSTVGGTVLTTSGGQVAVTGTLQDTDTYTIIATFSSSVPVTGLFLNAIDTNGNDVVGGGPGREPVSGNFVVSEFTVTAVPEPAERVLMLGGLVATILAKRRSRGGRRMCHAYMPL